MHWPYRIAAPPEPERTEEADRYERTLVDSDRPLQKLAFYAITGAALGTFALATVQAGPSPARRAHLLEQARIDQARTTVEEAERALDDEQNRFDQELRLTLSLHRTATPLTACPTTIGEPDRLIRGRAMIPMLVVRIEQPRYWSPTVERAQGDVRTARSLLDGPSPAAAVVYADALAASPVASRLGRDVIFVVSKWQSPARSSVTSFEPGIVEGVAYVYDFAQHRITCAGEIHASNSKRLEYSYNEASATQGVRLDATLADDLDLQLARAIAAPQALAGMPPFGW